MYIKTKYPFHKKLLYVPTYFRQLNEEQLRNQQIVLNFKNGIYDEEIMKWFRHKVWDISKGHDIGWVVCFLPCRNEETQKKRFGKLAEYLSKTTRTEIHLTTFGYAEDRMPSHITGKEKISIMDIALNLPDIFAKNVILIDDVITTGNLYNKTAEQAMRMGANAVYGLFLAKSVHPELPNEDQQQKEEDWYLEEWKEKELSEKI